MSPCTVVAASRKRCSGGKHVTHSPILRRQRVFVWGIRTHSSTCRGVSVGGCGEGCIQAWELAAFTKVLWRRLRAACRRWCVLGGRKHVLLVLHHLLLHFLQLARPMLHKLTTVLQPRHHCHDRLELLHHSVAIHSCARSSSFCMRLHGPVTSASMTVLALSTDMTALTGAWHGARLVCVGVSE